MIFVAVSTGHFDPLIKACASLHQQYEFRGQIGSGKFTPPFAHFRTAAPQEIEACMAESEFVITHAGTGMLSMLYRLKKPSIVVPKQVRYGESNDGQVELAKKWAEQGMAHLCMDVADLSKAIKVCQQKEFHFPKFARLGLQLEQDIWPTRKLEAALSQTHSFE